MRQYLNPGLNMTEMCSEVHQTCFTAPHNCSCWTRTSLPLLCGPPVVCLWPSQPPQSASIGSRVQWKSPTWRKFGTIKSFAFLAWRNWNENLRDCTWIWDLHLVTYANNLANQYPTNQHDEWIPILVDGPSDLVDGFLSSHFSEAPNHQELDLAFHVTPWPVALMLSACESKQRQGLDK